MKNLRVGTVPYLVGRPLDESLASEPGIDLVRVVPSALVDELREGRVDVALVSSIELFRQPGYRFIDTIAVAGEGSVGSVQLFLRKPVKDLERVALDPASRTARTLTRILLNEGPERPTGPPEFVEVPRGADPRAADADAWLRIGDEALREFLAPDAPPVFNPSKAWTAREGLPFVFAAWIVRPDCEIEPHLPAFVRARHEGRKRVEQLAQEASRTWNLPLDHCRHYLMEECLYEPGEKMHPALTAFQRAAARLDLCRGDLDPRPIPLPGDGVPQLIKDDTCPHCGIKLDEPKPRVCPSCMGSLQQRYLRAGCLSSGPAVFLIGLGICLAAVRLL